MRFVYTTQIDELGKEKTAYLGKGRCTVQEQKSCRADQINKFVLSMTTFISQTDQTLRFKSEKEKRAWTNTVQLLPSQQPQKINFFLFFFF